MLEIKILNIDEINDCWLDVSVGSFEVIAKAMAYYSSWKETFRYTFNIRRGRNDL